MCSRYSLTSPPEAVRSDFRYLNVAEFPPRYNIAPTQPVAIVLNNYKGERELALVRWGLIPAVGQGSARVLDPHQCPLRDGSRQALVSRCFASSPVPRAHGRLLRVDRQARSQAPHCDQAAWSGPMAMAGLWEHWVGADGSELGTMAILTCGSNRLVSALHDRMPAIVAPEAFDLWLDCKPGTAEHLRDFLHRGARGTAGHHRGLAQTRQFPQRWAERVAAGWHGAPSLEALAALRLQGLTNFIHSCHNVTS